ncbi:hypothetical protein ASA1KI_30130 [Opitutales bacterium ASA1]|uniref:RHS repeat domain-containing protein n=1 Tax=Congregicoccus parvus TaxID=3081749 RepID=UPI002B2D2FD9|nr:hypothetical protein ASA1KI_30130 [Opitutales bacterium ASA1]
MRNPKGVVTRVTTNSQGWETEVVQNETGLVFDADSGEQTTLTKTYDALGNLLTSSTAGSTIVNVFDRRGRRLQTTDPDMGTWTYTYNGFGELVEQVDAKFQKTTHTYDVLGRPQSLSKNSRGMSFAGKGASRKARPARGIPVGAIPAGRNAADGPFPGKPSGRQRSAPRAALCPRAKALRALAPRTRLARWHGSLAATGLGRFWAGFQSRLHRNASGNTIQNTVWTWFGAAAALGSRGKLHGIETFAENVWKDGTSLNKETHAYDALGRPTSSTRTIPDAEIPAVLPGTPLPSTSYTTTLHYDAVSRVERVVYRTGFATRNVYNAFGALKEVRRSDAGRNDVFWMAEHDAGSDPSVAISRFLLGNGVTTERIASRATGRVRDIASGVRGGFGLQQIEYDYDVLGNVKTRTDAATGLVENAFYDALNRLDGFISTLGANVTNTDVDYAANGNITWKSDVGAYAYGAAGAGPHAVTSAGAHTYTYDANGGMLTGAGRAIQWTAFNQFRRIDQGGQFSEFWFGAAHERVGQRNNHGRTVYVGGIYERFTPTGSGPTEHRHWITTPAGRIAVHKTFSTGAPKTDYFHHDALGSITVVTNEKGVKVERFRYDAWGNRLDGSGQPVLWANNAGITRGFTDHEHLDDLGLVHMNGRVYDPVLARFLSADPFIDGVSDSPGFNRYTYVHNNPLNATDPSGFLSFKDVLKIVAVVVAAVVTAGIAVYAAGVAMGYSGMTMGFALSSVMTGAVGSWGAGWAVVAGAGAGFGSGFAGSLLNGGSLGDAFQAGLVGGLIGGVSAGVAYGIGSLAKSGGFYGDWQHHALHGLAQGGITEATGGEFRHGFYAAAFASAAADSIASYAPGGVAGQAVAAAVVGGTASALGGGKFANGAASGAFTYLFNEVAHRASKGSRLTLDEESRNEITKKRAATHRYIHRWKVANPGSPIPLDEGQFKSLADYEAMHVRDRDRTITMYELVSSDTFLFAEGFGGDVFQIQFDFMGLPAGQYLGGDVNYMLQGMLHAHSWNGGRASMEISNIIWNAGQSIGLFPGDPGRGQLGQIGRSRQWMNAGFDYYNELFK